jgi:DNA polymerase III chi subunit, HolC
MTEVLFYHLEHQSLERTLPALVERTLERNWRAVIQVGSEERVEALDTLLWTYREESFLPHGTRRDGNPEQISWPMRGSFICSTAAMRARWKKPASNGNSSRLRAARLPIGSNQPRAAGRKRPEPLAANPVQHC